MIAAFAKPPPTFAASTLNSTNCMAQPVAISRQYQRPRAGAASDRAKCMPRRSARDVASASPAARSNRLDRRSRSSAFSIAWQRSGATSIRRTIECKPHPNDAPQMNGLQLTRQMQALAERHGYTPRPQHVPLAPAVDRAVTSLAVGAFNPIITMPLLHLRAGRCAGWFR